MLTLTQMDQKVPIGGNTRISLTRGCLALNASYEPLTVLSVKRAVRLLLDQKAEVIEVDNTKAIRSGNGTMPFPVVIRLVRYVNVPRRLRSGVTNTILFARDGRRCAYCGRHEKDFRQREYLTRDHILPTSRGGTNIWANCITACTSCNNRKANKTPSEAGMKLLFKPTEPHFVKLVWTIRRLTPLQRKYVAEFFGDEVVAALE